MVSGEMVVAKARAVREGVEQVNRGKGRPQEHNVVNKVPQVDMHSGRCRSSHTDQLAGGVIQAPGANRGRHHVEGGEVKEGAADSDVLGRVDHLMVGQAPPTKFGKEALKGGSGARAGVRNDIAVVHIAGD